MNSTRFPIPIDPAHASALRDCGEFAVLVWDETATKVHAFLAPHLQRPLDDTMMVIAGHTRLNGFITELQQVGVEPTDAALAESLGDLARDVLAAWPLLRALTPTTMPLRAGLADACIYLVDACAVVSSDDGVPRLREFYRSPLRPSTAITVTTALGCAAPTRITIAAPGQTPLELTVDTAGRPPAAAALITAPTIETAVFGRLSVTAC